jgi:hypothetical protein
MFGFFIRYPAPPYAKARIGFSSLPRNQVDQPQNLQFIVIQRAVQLIEHGLEIHRSLFVEHGEGYLLLFGCGGGCRLQISAVAKFVASHSKLRQVVENRSPRHALPLH